MQDLCARISSLISGKDNTNQINPYPFLESLGTLVQYPFDKNPNQRMENLPDSKLLLSS
jgi:hypothetical protein